MDKIKNKLIVARMLAGYLEYTECEYKSITFKRNFECTIKQALEYIENRIK